MKERAGGRIITAKRRFRQNRLSFRIALITFLSAVVGILGVFRLSWNMHQIVDKYNHIMERDYRNVVYMDEISRKLHEHQSLLYHHLNEPDEGERSRLEGEAVGIQTELTEMLIEFGANMNGTSYESYFHNIYSGLIGYFDNVDLIFSFSDRGDMKTAAYYMQISLNGDIQNVNRNLDELDDAIAADMRESRAYNDAKILNARIESTAIILLVFIFAVTSIVLCTKISASMVRRDLLTGVHNFDSIIKNGGKLEKSGKLRSYTAMALSLKNFKYINQEYGSLAGDEVLIQYATQLTDAAGNGGLVARNGGDNFLILLKSEYAERFLESMKTFRAEIRSEYGDFCLTLFSRCGVAPAKEHSTITNLVDACQLALGAARATGEDIVTYENAMAERLQVKKRTLETYQKALEEHEFVPFYQPKVDMKENRLAGAEALARWKRDGRIVPPAEFIPFLEEEGELEELDFYIFEDVCRDLRTWMDQGITPVRVSSNFSKLHLKNTGFAERVLRILEKYGVDGKYVQIEITESSGYEDLEALQRFTKRMHENGVSISVDDFGTGYSSLSMLKNIEADVVKLDRSFLFGVGEETDPVKEKLITNIVRMIHDLDRIVVCEGVETERHVEFLRSAGCTYAQGFYYDMPLQHDDYEKRLREPHYTGR